LGKEVSGYNEDNNNRPAGRQAQAAAKREEYSLLNQTSPAEIGKRRRHESRASIMLLRGL
jgi:hypothetical protein